MDMLHMAALAKSAAVKLGVQSSQAKNAALSAIASALSARAEEIIAANRRDLAVAEQAGIAPAVLKRLNFGEAKLAEVRRGIDSLIALPDPVGKTLQATELDDGLELYQVSCPWE